MEYNFHLAIITPHSKIFEGEVHSVVVPGELGSLGILAHHAPLLSNLSKGILKFKNAQGERYFAVHSGIVEVGADHHCLVLTDEAKEGRTLEEIKQYVQQWPATISLN